MNTNNAIPTYDFIACLTVKVCLLLVMRGTEQSLLERRNRGGYISGQSVQVDDLVACKIVPVLMGLLTESTDKPTTATKANRLAFGALVAHCLVV